MNRYQEVLSRAKEVHSAQAIVEFKLGKLIEGTRLTPLWQVSKKQRVRTQRGWGEASSEEVNSHRGGNDDKYYLSKPLQTTVYMFRCECGIRKEIKIGTIMNANGHLKPNGGAKSCGCLRKENFKLAQIASRHLWHRLRDKNGRFKKKLTWDGNNT